jgi:hypothetical protein
MTASPHMLFKSLFIVILSLHIRHYTICEVNTPSLIKLRIVTLDLKHKCNGLLWPSTAYAGTQVEMDLYCLQLLEGHYCWK